MLISRANAIFLGRIGQMSVYISTRDIPEWPEGAIGVILSVEPFKIFSKDIDWVRNPVGHDMRDHVTIRSPLWKDWQAHVKAQQLLLREQIKGPMMNYLFIGHLFYDGYSMVKHISWASYFMDRVAQMLQSPKITYKLLGGVITDGANIHD